MAHEIEADSRVMYSRAFLQSTGQLAGEVPFATGRVLSLEYLQPDFILALVEWDHGYRSRANTSNLVRMDRLHLEPA